MVSAFGRVVLALLDERGLSVPDLVEELRPALERAGLDYSYTTEEIVAAITDPLAPCYVGMILGIAEALALNMEEYLELVRAASVDARWGLTCNREGWVAE